MASAAPAKPAATPGRAKSRAASAAAGRAKPTRHADAEQQELLVVVAARLADGALRRPRVRRGDGLARRRRRAQGTAAAGAVDPRALPDARGRQGLEHAGHRPVPQRDQARCRPDAGRPHRARALPLGQRRDELGLRQPARVAADEPEGALPGYKIWAGAQPDIDRIVEIWTRVPGHLRRPVPVRRAARHGRRDVRAGGHALPHLRRAAGQAVHRSTARPSWRCPR